ncbi:hypothetical protein AAII07_58945, partial [Microvirga sp. 0TCS3.31]
QTKRPQEQGEADFHVVCSAFHFDLKQSLASDQVGPNSATPIFLIGVPAPPTIARISTIWHSGEAGGPALATQPSPGFRSRLPRQTITRELAGQLDIRYEREGACCTKAVPLGPTRQQAA